MKKIAIFAALLLSTVSLGAAATAATAERVAVRIDDLNLSTPAGAKELDRRAVKAAYHFCRQKTDGVEASTRFQQTCRRDVRAEIYSKL